MSNVKMPEPITADEVMGGYIRLKGDEQFIEVEQAEAYAQARVDEVESAALAALEESLCGQLGEFEQKYVLDDVKKAIRALKEQS